MATAATEITPVVSEPELLPHILQINQDHINIPDSPETNESREPFSNTMEAIAMPNYGQPSQYPIYATPEIDEKLDQLEIADEAPAFNTSPCNNRSPLPDSILCNDNNNSFKLEEMKPLHPQILFPANEQKNFIRQDSYTQTHEDRGDMHYDAASNYYTDFNGMPHRNIINFTAQQCPDSINIPYKFSDVPSPRRYAWGDERHLSHLQNEGGYNSDSDILRNKSRNKKSSLDDYVSGSSPEFGDFVKGHRRVRSGDAPMLNINTNNRAQQQSYMRQNAGNPHQMLHSQSQGSIQLQTYHQIPPRQPLLNQSVSVDCSPAGSTQVHEHLCTQTTAFLNLQAAIADATKECEQLEKNVESKNRELNVGLNVEYRTEKDCKLVENDIKQLRKEIQAMYDECDQSGVQVPGDPPAMSNRRISDIYPNFNPVSPSGGYERSPSVSPAYPVQTNTPLRPAPVTPPIITVQPGKRQKSKDSPYENVPDYKRNDPKRNDGAPHGAHSSQSPPPIPPRQPMMIAANAAIEQWRCPTCTFDNLLVANCEMCQTPRPCVLRNNIQR